MASQNTPSAHIHWAHDHDYTLDSQHQEKKVGYVFWLTTIVMVLEITAGTWSGSMALLADGWHMGTHSAAFAITLFAYWYAKQHANNRAFSFGTGKVNYLGGFASAVALAIVALMMIIESVQRLIQPNEILFNEAILVAIIGLVVNIASVFLLHDSHHHHHEHEHEHEHEQHNHTIKHNHANNHSHDHNLKAAYLHVLADTLTSVLAIIALLAGKYFGLIWMDAVMGIIGACVIAKWSYGLIKETSNVLLDKSVNTKVMNQISRTISQMPDTQINDLHIWKISPAHYASIISISSNQPISPECYAEKIKLCYPAIAHISVEVTTN